METKTISTTIQVAQISELSVADRELIELRYFKGLTQVKTAEILGMSQVQVSRKEKALLLRMRKSMNGE